jgi:hypothetical protein
VQCVRNQAFFGAVDSHTGLIAACFDAQNVHRPRIIPQEPAAAGDSAKFARCGRLQQGLELTKMYRYNRRLSPGHVPGLFMFGNKIVCPVFA